MSNPLFNLPRMGIRQSEPNTFTPKPAECSDRDRRRERHKQASADIAPKPVRKQIPARKRFRILHRYHWTCQYCWVKAGTMRNGKAVEVDVEHRISVADGGDDSDDNLTCACTDCNSGKGRKSVK